MKKIKRSPFLDFNARIYGETMRQLRTLGILALVILSLAAVLLPVGIVIEAYSYLDVGESPHLSLVSLLQMHPLLVAPMYTLALLFPLMTFGYLNKRASADFYHAMPVNRDALFVSQFTAMMSWLAIVILGSCAISIVTTLCFPAVFQLNLSTILPYICGCFAGALMVMGCVTVAMCITGTLFNNLLVAAIICFLPRILMAYCGMLLGDTVNILYKDSIPLLNWSYNIPIGLPVTVVTGEGGAINMLHNWHSIGYTTLIACVWFIAAAVLFRIRRSEAAERPASTPLLQHAYRLIIAFTVTLIPTYVIMIFINEKTFPDASEAFLILVFYILAAIAFCVYELITTKKPKELLRVAKTFPLVLLADIVLIAGLQIAAYVTLQFRPAAEDIVAISFAEQYYDDNSYFESRAAKVEIQSDALNQLVAKRLENAAEKNHPRGELTDGKAVIDKYSYSYVSSDYAMDNYTRFVVTIKTKHGAKQRLLDFNAAEYEQIVDTMSKTPAYQDVYRLPVLNHQTTIQIPDLTATQAAAVYDVLAEEVAAMPFEQRVAFLSGNWYDNKEPIQAHCGITTAIGVKEYNFGLSLSHGITPKAVALYMEYLHENTAEDRATILQIGKNFDTYAKEKTDFCFSIHARGENANWRYADLPKAASETARALVKEIVTNTLPDVPQANDVPLFSLSCGYATAVEFDEFGEAISYNYESYSSYIVLNEKGIKAFEQLYAIVQAEENEK